MNVPTLKQHPKSDGCGEYYVTADIHKATVTLNCTSVSKELYRKLGYSPGEELPERLTWKLYEMNHHEIEETSLDEEKIQNYAQSRINKDIDDKGLSEERLRELHGFIFERHPEVENIMKLGEVYGISIPERFRGNSRENSTRFRDDIVTTAVENWGISGQKEKISGDHNLQKQFREMYQHPRKVTDVRIDESTLYELDCTDLPVSYFSLYDHRENDDPEIITEEVPESEFTIDFQVGFTTDRETHRFTLRRGRIVNWSFGNSPGEIEEVDEGIYESPDRYRHGLTKERNELRDILEDFFEKHGGYALSNAGLGTRLDSYSATVASRGAPSFEERENEKNLIWIDREDELLLVETLHYQGDRFENHYITKRTIISENEAEIKDVGKLSSCEVETDLELKEESKELRISNHDVNAYDGIGSSDIPLTDKVYDRLKDILETE